MIDPNLQLRLHLQADVADIKKEPNPSERGAIIKLAVSRYSAGGDTTKPKALVGWLRDNKYEQYANELQIALDGDDDRSRAAVPPTGAPTRKADAMDGDSGENRPAKFARHVRLFSSSTYTTDTGFLGT